MQNQKTYSITGKIYEKCNKNIPFNRQQRQKMYQSCQISKIPTNIPVEKKFSPFNTVSRNSRNSFLLRVTKEPHTQTNYSMDYNVVLKKSRQPTIDQASFTRIIGPIIETDFAIKVDNSKRDRRCTSACIQSGKKRPLTTRQTHNWRKNNEHLDFSKQINPEWANSKQLTYKGTSHSKETQQSEFINERIRNITQSNFNNFKRFSLQLKTQRSHDFNSYSAHEYLKQKADTEQPHIDILQAREQYLRKSFKRPIGQMRFQRFREQIKTRVDRSDPNWVQSLEYQPNYSVTEPTTKKSIVFKQSLGRKANQVRNKYPIRQNLKQYVPMNKFK